MSTEQTPSNEVDPNNRNTPTRRVLVTGTCAGALALSYGTFFSFAGRYLYPSKPTPKG